MKNTPILRWYYETKKQDFDKRFFSGSVGQSCLWGRCDKPTVIYLFCTSFFCWLVFWKELIKTKNINIQVFLSCWVYRHIYNGSIFGFIKIVGNMKNLSFMDQGWSRNGNDCTNDLKFWSFNISDLSLLFIKKV